jgi:prepilin-type N-terminal cleavage/methylation domain-containing protein
MITAINRLCGCERERACDCAPIPASPPVPIHRYGYRYTSGFTLIEVLIAVVIFALMATVAYRGLTAVLESKRHVDAESDKWRKAAILFTRLERDLAVVAPRPIRD